MLRILESRIDNNPDDELSVAAGEQSKITKLRLEKLLQDLVISLAKEIPPLAPPEADVYENWVFFLRSWAVTGYIGGSVLVHMNQCIPRIQLSVRQIVFVGMFAAAFSTAVVFVISALTVFPLPFGLLVFGPPDAWMLAACFAFITRPLWRSDPYLWTEVKQQLDVIHSQMSLTFVYPIYIYGFVTLTGVMKVLFVLTLPIIRIIAKNRISRTLNTHDDMKPEVVILTVEVFNALYISNALRLTSSWSLTGTVMILDLVLFFSSMLDVATLLKDVKLLMNKIPPEHPMASENFLQVAMRILNVNGSSGDVKYQRNARHGEQLIRFSALSEKALNALRAPTPTEATIIGSSRTQRYMRQVFQNAQVLPTLAVNDKSDQQPFPGDKLNDTQSMPVNRFTMDITAIFSLAERAAFIDKATRVLFVTEYLVLMEYTEVMIPVMYSHRGVFSVAATRVRSGDAGCETPKQIDSHIPLRDADFVDTSRRRLQLQIRVAALHQAKLVIDAGFVPTRVSTPKPDHRVANRDAARPGGAGAQAARGRPGPRAQGKAPGAY
ncbi:hypothetical protein ON010_g5053 [Phytophthora cinnamomi]|nr:hypothetical protein ON010_g5053 [Phytophthora cinnamomi]